MTEERSHVLWELVQTAHLAGRAFGEVFAGCGITHAQYGVLASLADGDDLSQADLARAVLVRPQSMGRLIIAMIEQGLVVRAGSGGRGKRSRLELTAEGERVLQVARPAAYGLISAEVIGLDPQQVQALTGLLREVRAHLQEPSRGGTTVPERDAPPVAPGHGGRR